MKRSGSRSDDDEFPLLVQKENEEGRVVESRLAKILRRCSSSAPPEEKKEEEDRISQLPDHVLVLILSLMIKGQDHGLGGGGEIEQVVRSSVLSRRWRSLWNYSLKRSLNFTYLFLGKESECVEFVHRVNRILALPVFFDDTTTTIDDFNLTLSLIEYDHHTSPHIPSWIDFALQKRVKRLTINLHHWPSSRPFTLDTHVLIRDYYMDSLVSLCLLGVPVTGPFLEHLLTTRCPSLQHLSITDSTDLVHFTVSGPKLKHLEIELCPRLKHLHIRNAANLVSFKYRAYLADTHVLIEDSPRLVNGHFKYSGQPTKKVLSYLPRLQTLVLVFADNWGLGAPPLVFPKLLNLMKLELELNYEVFSSTVCASLLVSCPSITQLILKFQYLQDRGTENKVASLKHPHQCLKVVQLVGFIGCNLDTGVALYTIDNTLSLDKIVVDTSHPYRSTPSLAEAVARDTLGLSPPPSESEMQYLTDLTSRQMQKQMELDMRARARAIAHAKQHLGPRLSGTRTQLVIK